MNRRSHAVQDANAKPETTKRRSQKVFDDGTLVMLEASGWPEVADEIERLRATITASDDVIHTLELGLGHGEKWTVERMEARDAAVARHRETLKHA